MTGYAGTLDQIKSQAPRDGDGMWNSQPASPYPHADPAELQTPPHFYLELVREKKTTFRPSECSTEQGI